MKGVISLTIVAACGLASCGRSSPQDEKQASISTTSGADTASRRLMDSSHLAPSALIPSPPQAADSLTGLEALKCTPTVATLKDTITLRMETPHGEYLTVTRPDSHEIFLAYPQPTEPRNFFLVPGDSFVDMPTIRFRADLKSGRRIDNRDTLEAVFGKPGKYVLTIGHKLESEQSSEIHKCTIRVVSSKK